MKILNKMKEQIDRSHEGYSLSLYNYLVMFLFYVLRKRALKIGGFSLPTLKWAILPIRWIFPSFPWSAAPFYVDLAFSEREYSRRYRMMGAFFMTLEENEDGRLRPFRAPVDLSTYLKHFCPLGRNREFSSTVRARRDLSLAIFIN